MTELKVEPGFYLQNPFSLHYTMLTPEVLRLCSFIHSKRSNKQISFSLESENCRCLKLNNQREVWSNGKDRGENTDRPSAVCSH